MPPKNKNTVPKRRQPSDMPARDGVTAADAFEAPSFVTKPLTNPNLVAQPPYMCSCCSKQFEEQKGNFISTDSDIFAANNHYTTICKSCLDKYYLHLLSANGGDEKSALHRVAQLVDLYVNDDIIADTIAEAGEGSVVGRLSRRAHWKTYSGKTYLNTMTETPYITLQAQADTQTVDVDERAVMIFGSGCEAADYAAMLEHYDSLASQFDASDVVQNSLIKDLCQIKVLQQKAYVRGDMDTFDKATKLYQQTMKTSGLQPKQDNSESLDDDKACFGVWKGQIEQYCPADIYKDKQLFADVDKIKEYFDRFILRPVCNFFSGERRMDPEYSLTPEEMSDGSAQ